MPRLPRPDVPDVPQHVIQRGNDWKPCFFSDEDCVRYRNDLREIAIREGCAVHAYVLMTNHVHLLIAPGTAGAIGRVMQSLGRRYVRHVNDRYHRTGTLWEGRYKACLVEDDEHLLRCYRYIELNPLRAGMVADPGDYRWSSHRCNAFGEHDPLVSPHRAYRSLHADPVERQRDYRALVMDTVDPEELEAIRLYLQCQHAYGSNCFGAEIESQLGRLAGPRKSARPRTSGWIRRGRKSTLTQVFFNQRWSERRIVAPGNTGLSGIARAYRYQMIFTTGPFTPGSGTNMKQ